MAEAKKNTATKKTTPKATPKETPQVAEENEQPTNEQSVPEIKDAKAQPEEPAHDHAQRSASSIMDDNVRGRWTQAKAVLYTDGLSGHAEQNLERAYEFNERLQSNDPAVRQSGDEALSDAAKESRDDRDSREAQQVIDGGRVNQ